jgi:hypothetical protein
MLSAVPRAIEPPAGPQCYRCGAQARLFGIESHPRVEQADLHTYVCTRCDGVQTEIVPLPR